jgi:hypothetical protein
MKSDELNDIVLAMAEKIENAAGRELSNTEKYALNDKVSEFLQDVDIDVSVE